jgi:sulfur-carrier protein
MSTVLLPGALRQYSDGARRLDIDLGHAAPLAEILDAVEGRCPRLARRLRDEKGELRRYVNVYLDGVDARELGGAAALVAVDAEVLVLPSVAGG